MKFALVNGDKVEASRGAKGSCPSCGAELIAKCGEIKVNHWAHRGSRYCDLWWENETDWHRSWKENFSVDCQEIIHRDDNGEKHIADVRTHEGWVLEFQHSYLDPEERRSRNAFYSKLVWVVDGTRRKTDKRQFEKTIEESAFVINSPSVQILRVLFPEECRLLQEWHDSNSLVFFDFQEAKETTQSMLWFLFPKVATNEAYIALFSRQRFIEMHNENKFDEIISNVISPIQELVNDIQIRRKNIRHGHPSRVPGFDMASPRRRQRRF